MKTVRNTTISGSGAFESPSGKTRGILKRLWKYLSKYRWMLIFVLAAGIAGNLLALMGPKLSGLAVDAIQAETGVDFPRVIRYVAIMLILYAASAAISYALAAVMTGLSKRAVKKLREDAFEKLTRLPAGYFDGRPAGDIISVISYDVDMISAALSADLVQMLSSAVTIAGSLVMMIIISPPLMLIFAVTVPAAFLFTRMRSKRVRPMYKERSERMGDANGFVEEAVRGAETIRVYGSGKAFAERFDSKNEAAVESNFRAESYACLTGPSVSFINNLSLALISVFGAFMYISGRITLGGISSFVLYSRKFSGPINEFSNIMGDMMAALAAAERVLDLIDEKPEAEDEEEAIKLWKVNGEVCVQNVSFSYSRGRTVLDGVSFNAAPGSIVAIVGETGCGKTTLINLLMRFYDPESGRICVDGTDIKKAERESLRRSFAMVLQDTWFFEGSVYDNIAYGASEASREDVMAAAKAAHIHSYITSLPQGYDTVLREGGANISKGQRQLLSIARAMLLDAPMLILDEATSNVDTRTEKQIQSAMLSLMQDRTCFIIAHRLSTIIHADNILFMSKGRILEQGTHEELMELGGGYYKMYRAQFEGVQPASFGK